jgi:succinyl-diaminopimelate desuccinylase
LVDAVELSRDLIRCPSVTPKEAGAIDLLIRNLGSIGFTNNKLVFGDVTNLYSKIGDTGPNFCFAGHVDVVHPGVGWRHDPFAAHIDDDILYGRGAVDMKPAIAAFISATKRFTQHQEFNGSISLLISGNEEGNPEHGTPKLVEWLHDNNETIDHCLVGEPTNPDKIGEMAKLGRRGSICFTLEVEGKQGHVAYQENANNPLTMLVRILDKLSKLELDEGNERFLASNLEITNIDVGNESTNVIPGSARALFNIRFNDEHNIDSLYSMVNDICGGFADKFSLEYECDSNAFYCYDQRLADILTRSIHEITSIKPQFSTTGGTSDARFIKDICPVIEFGLINKTAHAINEHVRLKDIQTLEKIYLKILENYFL